MSESNFERPRRRRCSIRRGDGLRPIAQPIADLLHRNGCDWSVVVEVLRSAGLDDDATGAPPDADR